MEQSQQEPRDERDDDQAGQDHREPPPGHDLDEQQAIEDLKRQRADDE